MSDPYDIDPLAEVLRISAEYRAEIVEFRRVLGEIVACDDASDFGDLRDQASSASIECWPVQSPRLRAALAEASAFLETGPPPALEPAQLPPEVAALRLQAFAITREWIPMEGERSWNGQQMEWADKLVEWARQWPDAGDGA